MQLPQRGGKNLLRNRGRMLQQGGKEPAVAELCLLVSGFSNTHFPYTILNLDLSLLYSTICLFSGKLLQKKKKTTALSTRKQQDAYVQYSFEFVFVIPKKKWISASCHSRIFIKVTEQRNAAESTPTHISHYPCVSQYKQNILKRLQWLVNSHDQQCFMPHSPHPQGPARWPS